MNEPRCFEFVLRGRDSLVLFSTLAVSVLCAVGVVAVGCYQTDRSNEKREGQSDASAFEDADAVAERTSDNEEDIDAAPNSLYGEDASTDQPPVQDAAPPDLNEITNRCGVLREWISDEIVHMVTVIQGADGFAGTKPEINTYYEPIDLYIFDALGQEVGLFGLDAVPIIENVLSTPELVKVMKSGSRSAVMTRCLTKGGFCGHRMRVFNEEPKNASGSGLDSAFSALEIRSVPPLLFTLAPNDSLLVGLSTGNSFNSFSGPIELAWLSSDINQSSDVMTLSTEEIPGATVISSTEDCGDASSECSVWELEVDEQGQVFVLLERRETVSGEVLETIRFQSIILVLSDDFTVLGEYHAPYDVRIHAIRSIEPGRIIVAGSDGAEEQTQVWFNMLSVDESGVFSDAWPEARVDGTGGAYAIDIGQSGDFVLAGTDALMGLPWIQRYDDSGTPLCPQRVGVSPEDFEYRFVPMDRPDVSIQSDGSIFLSFGSIAFVYYEQ